MFGCGENNKTETRVTAVTDVYYSTAVNDRKEKCNKGIISYLIIRCYTAIRESMRNVIKLERKEYYEKSNQFIDHTCDSGFRNIMW